MLTDKQEKFAFNVAVKGMNYTQAWLNAGYSDKYPRGMIYSNASRLVAKSQIKLRIQQLRDELEGPDFLSQAEYIRGLTDIYRTRITDFQSCGADGSYIDIGPENPHVGSVAEIVSKTVYNDDGSDAALITRVKLHDKLQAGRDIAKIKGWWKEEGGNTTIINVDKVLIDARNMLKSKVDNLVARTRLAEGGEARELLEEGKETE